MRPLQLVEAKLARAQKAQTELRALCTKFIADSPVTLGAGVDDSGAAVARVVGIKEIPIEVPVVLGELFSSLRTLLDNLVWHLVEANGLVPDDSTCFPIKKSQAAYNKARAGLNVSGAVLAALDALKPYDGGDIRLWQLHQLDIRGKHRALVPALMGMRSTDGGLRAMLAAFQSESRQRLLERGLDNLPEVTWLEIFLRPADRQCPVKVGDVLFSMGTTGQPLPEVQFRFQLVLHEPPLLSEAPIDVVLSEVFGAVKDVVQKLEPHL